MNKAKEDLLLHPVRMRIILATAGRQVTAQQLASELPDIPQATLYRNINALAAGGILNIVQERRVHNTFEKTYALPDQGPFLTAEDLKNAQPEDYIRLFAQYLGMLQGYYVRYIQKGNVDFVRDNVSLSGAAHAAQKRLSAGFSVWHFGHATGFSWRVWEGVTALAEVPFFFLPVLFSSMNLILI